MINIAETSSGIVLEDQLNTYSQLLDFIENVKKINSSVVEYSSEINELNMKMNSSTYSYGGNQTNEQTNSNAQKLVEYWDNNLKLNSTQQEILSKLAEQYVKESVLIDQTNSDSTQKDMKHLASQANLHKEMLKLMYLTEEQQNKVKSSSTRFYFKK